MKRQLFAGLVTLLAACASPQEVADQTPAAPYVPPTPTETTTVYETVPYTPPPQPAPEPTVEEASSKPTQPQCHPSYRGACLKPNAEDYDCAGGSGNGPEYTGRVEVVGPDEYGLDRDGDGVGCE